MGRLALAGVLVLGALEFASYAEEPRALGRAPGTREETAPGQGVASYELEAVLDAEGHEVRGKGVIRWTNASRVPQRELWLHTYLNAFENDRTRFMRPGAPAGFRGANTLEHAGSIEVRRLRARELDAELWPGVTYGEENDRTDARVPLPRAVAPGESLTLDVEFTSVMPSLFLRTGYAGSFHMVSQWFPKLARLREDGSWAHFSLDRLSEFYADFGDYDVTVEVPQAFLVGATGEPVEDERRAGRRRLRFLASRVHDFAFVAWDAFEEVHRWAGPVELVALFPKGEAAEADLELGVVTRGLAHFGERYGAYPYRRLTIVRPPPSAAEAGGMEYPMLITTGASTRLRALGMRSIESLTLHELAHQWFYGLVATDEHRYPFLDEGLASYAAVEAMDCFWPGHAGFDALGLQVGEAAAYRLGAAFGEGHGSLDRAAFEFANGRDYAALVYARTATTLMTLARVYGPERMERALRNYAREQRFSHPVPEDLLAAVRGEVGDEAAEALRLAIAGGTTDVRLEAWESKPGADGRFVGTVSLRRSGSVVLPVEVDVRTMSGSTTRLRWEGAGERATLDWQGDGRMASVLVDPENRILLDGQLDARAGGGPQSAPRVWSLVTLLSQVGMSALWP